MAADAEDIAVCGLGMSPDDRLKPDAAPATGFSLSPGLERVA